MYIRSSHQPRDPADVLEVIRNHPFVTVVTASAAGMIASHLPVLIEGETLFAHMARANPHGAVIGEHESLVVFQGPHGYISPSWYADRATAPTWDYVAVHCYGQARLHSDGEARANIERLIEAVEAHRPNPWSIGELSEEEVEGLIRNVVSFEIPLARVEGKFKLNQGEKPERTRAAVAALEREGEGALADYIRRYNGLS